MKLSEIISEKCKKYSYEKYVFDNLKISGFYFIATRPCYLKDYVWFRISEETGKILRCYRLKTEKIKGEIFFGPPEREEEFLLSDDELAYEENQDDWIFVPRFFIWSFDIYMKTKQNVFTDAIPDNSFWTEKIKTECFSPSEDFLKYDPVFKFINNKKRNIKMKKEKTLFDIIVASLYGIGIIMMFKVISDFLQ